MSAVGVEVRALLAQERPYGASGPKAHSAGDNGDGDGGCPNDRPTWWMPAHHHCALDHELRRVYGITCADYWQLLERQDGRCGICGYPPGRWRLAVDHDHDTGLVRGLAHTRCQRILTVPVVRYLAAPPGIGLDLIVDTEHRQKLEARARTRRPKPKPTAPASNGKFDRTIPVPKVGGS